MRTDGYPDKWNASKRSKNSIQIAELAVSLQIKVAGAIALEQRIGYLPGEKQGKGSEGIPRRSLIDRRQGFYRHVKGIAPDHFHRLGNDGRVSDEFADTS